MQTQKTLKTDCETLSAALAMAKAITPRRTSIPILSAIQLRHTATGAEMVATDLDVYLSVSIPAESVDEGFSAVLPHSALADMVKKAPKGAEIAIDASGAGELASVALGAVRANLQAFPSQDWPEPKKHEGKPAAAFTVSTRDFGAALTRCAMAISTEETRYYLNGVYAHCVEAGRLRMVATDGHRLARAEIAADVKPEMPGVIIPKMTVDFLRKQCAAKSAPESLAVTIHGHNYATFTLGNVTAQSKLIDGTFPDYARVIPALKGEQSSITVDRAAFVAAIEQVATVSSERGRAFAMEPIEGGKLRLLVSNPETGDIGAEIACEHSGKAFVCGFNARYMLECLGAEKSETVSIRMEDSGSPALVGKYPGDAQAFVLMPMRVGDSTKAESREERNARMAKEAAEAEAREAENARRREVDGATWEFRRRVTKARSELAGMYRAHSGEITARQVWQWAQETYTVDAWRFAAAACEHEIEKVLAIHRPEDPRLAPLATFLAGLNPLTRGAVVARHGVDAPELAPIYDAHALAGWILEATRKPEPAPVAAQEQRPIVENSLPRRRAA